MNPLEEKFYVYKCTINKCQTHRTVYTQCSVRFTVNRVYKKQYSNSSKLDTILTVKKHKGNISN